MKRQDLLLYAVTDRAWLGAQTLAEQVEQALRGGVTMVQFREKHLTGEALEREARSVQEVCRKYHVPFLVNDDVMLAKKIHADGVHVGQGDMSPKAARELLGEDKIIGVTAKTLEQAKNAEADGADYLGSGAVFGSSTKLDTRKMDHALLDQICASVAIPVVAIGGIDSGNIRKLKGRKMAGFAVVSGIFHSDDIEAASRSLRRLAEEAVGMRTALTIAGSDCSGGAGIQADIKTMTAHGVYAMSAVTALTAQNTTGITGIMEVTPEFLEQQLDCIFTDIRPDAVKIGMVSSEGLILVIAEKLKRYQAEQIVIDPVMVSTSGTRLLSDAAIDVLERELLPLATVITPNIPETEVLSGMQVQTEEDMEAAARLIGKRYGCAILCKGGHRLGDANDLLVNGDAVRWFYGRRIDNPNTHGTGCTLSSAIASNLAKGQDLETAVEHAKCYLSAALNAGLDLGKGSGPMNHAFAISGNYEGK